MARVGGSDKIHGSDVSVSADDRVVDEKNIRARVVFLGDFFVFVVLPCDGGSVTRVQLTSSLLDEVDGKMDMMGVRGSERGKRVNSVGPYGSIDSIDGTDVNMDPSVDRRRR